jgi:hypothetical protein
MSNQLVCNSFDDQYKKIQSFRNQYLNMIRLVLKHKNKNHLTFEEIMDYNTIETKLSDILNDINNYTKELKIKSKKTKKQSIVTIDHPEQQQYNHDNMMAETLVAFLPYMILYYNHLQTVSLLTIPLD